MESRARKEQQEPLPVQSDALSLFGQTPLDRLLGRLGMLRSRRRLVLFWVCITWVPLLFLSLMGDQSSAQIAFLEDFPTHIRFLVALPLLVVLEQPAAELLKGVIPEFVDRGMIHEGNAELVSRAASRVRGWAGALAPECLLLVSAWVFARTNSFIELPHQISSWKSTGSTAAAAYFWHHWVSLVIYQFLLLRWLWKYALWSTFLLLLTRVRLSIQAHHPDQRGGLNFLLLRHLGLCALGFVTSTVLSANIGGMVAHGGSKLWEFRSMVIIYLGFAIAFFSVPLLAFTPSLFLARREGLLKYGSFASRHVIDFDKRWDGTSAIRGASPLGHRDITGVTDLDLSYEHLAGMRIFLVSRPFLMGLALFLVLPLVPLALSKIPLLEVLKWLAKALA